MPNDKRTTKATAKAKKNTTKKTKASEAALAAVASARIWATDETETEEPAPLGAAAAYARHSTIAAYAHLAAVGHGRGLTAAMKVRDLGDTDPAAGCAVALRQLQGPVKVDLAGPGFPKTTTVLVTELNFTALRLLQTEGDGACLYSQFDAALICALLSAMEAGGAQPEDHPDAAQVHAAMQGAVSAIRDLPAAAMATAGPATLNVPSTSELPLYYAGLVPAATLGTPDGGMEITALVDLPELRVSPELAEMRAHEDAADEAETQSEEAEAARVAQAAAAADAERKLRATDAANLATAMAADAALDLARLEERRAAKRKRQDDAKKAKAAKKTKDTESAKDTDAKGTEQATSTVSTIVTDIARTAAAAKALPANYRQVKQERSRMLPVEPGPMGLVVIDDDDAGAGSGSGVSPLPKFNKKADHQRNSRTDPRPPRGRAAVHTQGATLSSLSDELTTITNAVERLADRDPLMYAHHRRLRQVCVDAQFLRDQHAGRACSR
jgi:hypothetical protein